MFKSTHNSRSSQKGEKRQEVDICEIWNPKPKSKQVRNPLAWRGNYSTWCVAQVTLTQGETRTLVTTTQIRQNFESFIH